MIEPEDLPADLAAAPRPSSSRLEDVEKRAYPEGPQEGRPKGKSG